MEEYRPFQSMTETLGKCGSVRCKQYPPGGHLRPYIYCYWAMTSEADLEEPILHRVVPDGCVDIIFDLNGHSYEEVASLAGTMTKPISAPLENRVNYLAVRFQPGSFLHFFDSPADHYADQIMPLEMISGKREHELVERLIGENHIGNRIGLLEDYLTRLLMRSNKSDPAVTIAVCNILKYKGDVTILQLSRSANCSQRQLCRKFCKWVGVSPKSFCRIIRFQSTLRMLRSRLKRNLLSIALDGGYYDQSHFIHEFNSYFGLTPSEFMARNNF